MRPALPSLAVLLTAATLPAALWTGAGDGSSWDDPLNWADGAMPDAGDPVWDIPEGATVTLNGAVPGGSIIKRGDGTLRWEGAAAADAVQVEQGTFDFGNGMIWPEITLAGGTVAGLIMENSVIVSGGTLAARAEGQLTLATGPITLVDVSAAGGIYLDGAILGGNLVAESSIWCTPWSGSSRIDGHLHLAAGSAISWSMQDSLDVKPLIVTGELSSDYAMWLYFGLVDWTQPYWDQTRDILFVDAWEGGIVTAALMPDPYAGNETEGTWTQLPDASGDIILRWTPLMSAEPGFTPVPEASATPWATLAAAAAMLARRRFAEPKA